MEQDDKPTEVLSPVDYAVLMREVLVRLNDGIKDLPPSVDTSNLTNLITTAQDYLFYLEDNRRVLM